MIKNELEWNLEYRTNDSDDFEWSEFQTIKINSQIFKIIIKKQKEERALFLNNLKEFEYVVWLHGADINKEEDLENYDSYKSYFISKVKEKYLYEEMFYGIYVGTNSLHEALEIAEKWREEIETQSLR